MKRIRIRMRSETNVKPSVMSAKLNVMKKKRTRTKTRDRVNITRKTIETTTKKRLNAKKSGKRASGRA